MARIESVSYEALFNLGNYENERIGITLALEPGETPAAWARARQLVEEQHAIQEIERVRLLNESDDVYTLSSRAEQLRYVIRRLHANASEINNMLEKSGAGRLIDPALQPIELQPLAFYLDDASTDDDDDESD
ncbi:MAG: hypothetical protein HC914_11060 [Chloroflexaceae bacterium]|nr:hypothetical protein [Chloroflexaceae bacterium]